MDEIAPVLTLAIGAVLILSGARLARRVGFPETIGYGIALCIVVLALALAPDAWRAQWAGGDGGDRLLTYARLVGLTGLLFIAGTSFRVNGSHREAVVSFSILGVLLFATTTVLLRFVVDQSIGTSALIAATIVAASLWFPFQFQVSAPDESAASSISYSGAIALSAVAMLGLYFAAVLEAIPIVQRSVSVFVIVTLYELVKLAVLFAFAYFVASRFLARTDGHISPIRTNIGFILISVLFFALLSLTVGELGAVAVAFMAGVLWRQTNAGKQFSKSPRPLASALLLSFVFISLVLQSHGRQFTLFPAVLVIAVVAMALKVFLTWVVLNRHSMMNGRTLLVAAVTGFPGEMAILFLSFSVTRWAIEGPVFFALLAYALLSSLLIPVLYAATRNAANISASTRSVIITDTK